MTNDSKTDEKVEAPEPQAPALRIITPDTTPEEVAAIVAVFSALGGGEAAAEPAARSLWASPGRNMRTAPGRALAAGRGAWRASGLPR